MDYLKFELRSKILYFLDPLHQKISPFRKFLVQVSDKLNQAQSIKKMREFLQAEGHDILFNRDDQDISSLDILGAMIQAGLIASNDLSQLRKMVEFIPRIDLAPQIDEFNKNNSVCKKGKFVEIAFGRLAILDCLKLIVKNSIIREQRGSVWRFSYEGP